MEMLNFRFAGLAVLFITGVVFSVEIGGVVGQLCGADIGGLVTQCAAYVQKGTPMTDPSEACCELIRQVDIPCACKHVTKKVEQMVDMNKVVHVVSYCGKPVPKGMKKFNYHLPKSYLVSHFF
ncbi:hypothetical protein D8674_021078 [Pyrus ussuriensis x Pyrus communis]|uniref:Bifunctional inhibitor/plant lipid transfer protein/seed storage helical domain-containing protein n=1 Tax=Pyrus ussuriensis x Pyrus communis TaxID=2448454 RepID=A0A5N5HPM2_9ROSA|nr:hypothetical protein D8674_021078 [Pyrus ussuriensis x Pyrus communis]